jgi:DNA replication protein DnaC
MTSNREPTPREPLRALLQELNFKGMARALDDELDAADREARPAAEVLRRLLTEQALYQRERRLAYRLTQAKLPWQWTLDSFPFAQQPGVDKAQILGLGGLDFVRRAFNVVLIGKPGTGKTGIAMGLLRQACLNGYAGRFYNAQSLFDELYASLAWPIAAPRGCCVPCRACGRSSSTNWATSRCVPSRSTCSSA